MHASLCRKIGILTVLTVLTMPKCQIFQAPTLQLCPAPTKSLNLSHRLRIDECGPRKNGDLRWLHLSNTSHTR